VTTDRGPVVAVVRNGAFLALIPKHVRLKAWKATLVDGSSTTGSLEMTNSSDPIDE
jgi:hypothetical protein